MAASHVHASAADFVSRRKLAVSCHRSAHDKFSLVSHPFGYGAFRFFLWWLFLHRRLRPGNEAQLSSSCFAPFGGSSSEESHSFLSEWFEKASRPSLAEPFGFDSRRHRISSRLPLLSPSASPHRSPVPSSVSKAVTFVTLALYACRNFPSTFCVFYFL